MFQFPNEDATKYDSIIKKFEDHCNPKKNVVMKLFKFRNTVQKLGQYVNEFITNLKLKIAACEYKNEDPTMVRDQLIIRLSDKASLGVG